MPAAALPRRPPPAPRLLQRCLLLAVLLHVWLVLVFGNTSGSAAPGQGVWGSLTVKLLGRSGDAADLPPDTSGASGSSAQPGATSATATPHQPRSDQAPGATATGRWSPQDVPADAGQRDEPADTPPSTATLDLPEGFRPIEREPLARPASRLSPAPTPVTPLAPADLAHPTPVEAPRTPTPELPAPVGRLETPAEAAAPLAPPPRLAPARRSELAPLPTELPAPVQRLEPATADVTPPLPRSADLLAPPPATPAALSVSADLPAPVRRLEAPGEAAPAPPLLRATELRNLPTPAAPLTSSNAALPATVQRLEAPAAARGTGALPRPNELRAPASAARNAEALPGTQDLPAAVRRIETAEGAGAVAPLQRATALQAPATPLGSASQAAELSAALPGQVAGATPSLTTPAGPALGDPSASPNAAAIAAVRGAPGSPDASPQLGVPPPPPTAAASAPRSTLNLSLPRGDLAARHSPGLIELLPPPPERKSRLEQSIEDATNKDCRKAYSNAGILAAVPLAIDAARGKGCKW